MPIAITLLVSAPHNDNKHAFLLAFSASAHLPSLWSFNELIFISPTLKLNAAAENHKERNVKQAEMPPTFKKKKKKKKKQKNKRCRSRASQC